MSFYLAVKDEWLGEWSETKRTITLQVYELGTNRLVHSEPSFVVAGRIDESWIHVTLRQLDASQFVLIEDNRSVDSSIKWTVYDLIVRVSNDASGPCPSISLRRGESFTKMRPTDPYTLSLHSPTDQIKQHQIRYTYWYTNTNHMLFGIQDGKSLPVELAGDNLVVESNTFDANNDFNARCNNTERQESRMTRQLLQRYCGYFKERRTVLFKEEDGLSVWSGYPNAESFEFVRKITVGQALCVEFIQLLGDNCLMRNRDDSDSYFVINLITAEVTEIGVVSSPLLIELGVDALRTLYVPSLLSVFKGCRDLAHLVIDYLVDRSEYPTVAY